MQHLKLGHRFLVGLAGVVAVACTSQGAPVQSVLGAQNTVFAQSSADCFDSIVLVAIDGVQNRDVFSGELPGGGADGSSVALPLQNLRRMEFQGVAWGAPGSSGFFASGPNFVSLPGYMEMLSGSSDLSCTENDCRKMKRRTLFDDFSSAFKGDPSAVIASWSKIATAASASPKPEGFISTGAYFTRGSKGLGPLSSATFKEVRKDFARPDGYRRDPGTAKLALSYLEEQKPRFLFVSLGDTDEYAHENDREAYLRALGYADQFIGDVREMHSGLQEEGKKTLLLVTTDHGRALTFTDHGRRHPESARSFLLAEGSGIPAKGRIMDGPRRYLKDIAPTVRALCGVPQVYRGSGQILAEMF